MIVSKPSKNKVTQGYSASPFIPGSKPFLKLSRIRGNISDLRKSIALMATKLSATINICYEFFTALFTKIWNTIVIFWFSTKAKFSKFFFNFWMTIHNMKTTILEKFKICNSIIGNVPVNVVDNFFRLEKATKMFFHNKSMFSYISLFSTMRMPTSKNIPISISFNSSTFKIGHPSNYKAKAGNKQGEL